VRFSEKRINWDAISKDILNMYAPKLPFKYLHENKESAYKESDTNERYRR
jgi:hypothetical protein